MDTYLSSTQLTRGMASHKRTAALTEVQKAQRKRSKASPDDGGPTLLVYVVPTGIEALQARLRIWRSKAPGMGMQLLQDSRHLHGVSHLVLAPGLSVEELPQQVQQLLTGREGPGGAPPQLVTLDWLLACMAAGSVQPTTQYQYQLSQPKSDYAASPLALARKARRPQYARWLGHWDHSFNNMTDDEIVMQGVYSVRRSAALGNEPLVALLKELRDYEEALANDYSWSEEAHVEQLSNYRGLRYARAAAVVRGCSYTLRAPVQQHDLPFCGGITTVQINELLGTGTTAVLQLFRQNMAVRSSSGQERPDSVGAASRRAFKKLPGVGVHTARQWYMDHKCSTYTEVEAAAARGDLSLSLAAAFSLQHRDDMLHTPLEDVTEMEEYVNHALTAVTQFGWVVTNVGGGRREAASHDADFVVSHPGMESVEGVMQRLVQWMIDDQRLLSPEEAMCMVQVGKMISHIPDLKKKILKQVLEGGAPQHNLAADRYDHLFGVYRTHAGRYRRLDIILVPREEHAFGILGWTGSRQYLRFLRQWSVRHMGMHCNAHALARREGTQVLLIPSESPPYIRKKDGTLHIGWPPGWSEGRMVECERDIFELLGLPWREAWERNA